MFLAVKQFQCRPLSLHLFSWRTKCTPVSAFGRCNSKSQHVQFIQSFIKSTKWHRTKAEQHPSLCGTWTWLITKLVFLASIHLSVRPLKFVIMYNNHFFFNSSLTLWFREIIAIFLQIHCVAIPRRKLISRKIKLNIEK